MPQAAEWKTLPTPAPAGTFLLARNGRIAAAFCRDKKLRIWNLPESRELRAIEIGDRHFDASTISEDGTWIAAGDHSGSYTVWNASTGARQMQFDLPFYPAAMAFSRDAKRLAIAPTNEPVQIYDIASGKKQFELQRTLGGAQAVVFSPDGARIATADSDTVMRIWDGRNGELLARHTDFLLEPLAASFTPDGKHLVAAGGDKFVAILDAATGQLIRKSEKLVDPVAYLEVSPDGALAAAGLMHAANLLMPAPVVISETATARTIQEWLPPARILGGGWTIDGHLIVALGSETSIHLWRVK
jgi:WD40 repeat protein